MVRVAVTARTNRVSVRLPVIVSDGLNGYSLSGDGAATLPPDYVGWSRDRSGRVATQSEPIEAMMTNATRVDASLSASLMKVNV